MEQIDKQKVDKEPQQDPKDVVVFLLKILIIIIILSVIASLLLNLFISTDSSRSKIGNSTRKEIHWTEQNNLLDAYWISQEMIAEMLHSPSSAEFPSYSSGSVHIEKVEGTQMYVIGSFVNAQNRFGVALRQYYMITVEQTGPSTWKLIKFEWIDT